MWGPCDWLSHGGRKAEREGLLDPEASEQGGGQAGCREDGAGGYGVTAWVRLGAETRQAGRCLCSHPSGLGSQPQKAVRAPWSRAQLGSEAAVALGVGGRVPHVGL